MGLRFRRSIKLAPGVRINLSTRGAGLSVGPRGASVSVGARGVHGNVGIPGTGLSYRQRLDTPASQRAAQPALPAAEPIKPGHIRARVTEDGDVIFENGSSEPIPEYLYPKLRQMFGQDLTELLQQACDGVNAKIEEVGEIHRQTFPPSICPTYAFAPFEQAEPQRPVYPPLSLWARIFPWLQRQAEERQRRQLEEYQAAWALWEKKSAEHQVQEDKRRQLIEVELVSNVDAMEIWLEAAIQTIEWPRETLVSFEIGDGGRSVAIDVDLPEIEDMPTQVARVPSRGKRLSLKEMSPTAVQRLYMRHVHGVAFRLIGLAFVNLPTLERIVLAGYSQRRSKITGQLDDEYLYSVVVDRQEWSQLDFSHDGLAALDVVEALAQFDLRRSMSKTGVFKAIEPHQPEHYALNRQPAVPAG